MNKIPGKIPALAHKVPYLKIVQKVKMYLLYENGNMTADERKNKTKKRGKKVKAFTKKTKGKSKKKLSYEWRRINYFFELYDQ